MVLSPIEQQIKEKIEAVGIPLKDWDINIYRGILTGFNEAFIINGKKKDELIAEDPKSAEVIRPILRGRDIKRYSYDFADLYIIATFPSLKVDIEQYPSVKQHLLNFGFDRLKQTGDSGARKKTNNKWFETQDSISYWEDFSKQKIIWGEISDKTKFAIDLNGDFAAEATTFILVGTSLLFLAAYLNSSFSEYFFSQIGTTTGVGTVRWKKFTIEKLLVPLVSNERREEYEKIVYQIIERNLQNQPYNDLEQILNNLVYEDIGLTINEIKLIEALKR